MKDLDKYRQGNLDYLKKHFDLEKIYRFTLEHRVEILLQDDCQFHCYIDYKSGDGSQVYGIDIDPLTSMALGISSYIKMYEAKIKSNE
jgi:hypothetical protein